VKRAIDLLVAVPASLVLAIPCLAIALAIRLESRGPALYWSTRIGRDGRPFRMPKFRSMRIDAPEVATDRLVGPDQWITAMGRFLRRTSLDELPQVWSVIRGDMSLVGPRPALHNQHELIAARRSAGVQSLRPGITGWAQVNGRDEIPEDQKVMLDREYLLRASTGFDLWILALTALRVVRSDGVSH
jgi:O-antigen biosynthesis protein WbqP